MDTLPLPSLLRRLAHDDPQRPFVRQAGGVPDTLTDAVDACARWTSALREAGVEAGDRVAMFLPAGPDAIYAWLAINGLGAVEVPIHLDYRGRYLAHVFRLSEASVAVIAPQYVERLAEVVPELPALRQLVTVGVVREPLPLPSVDADAERHAAATPWEPVEQARRDPCTVLMTSGTTGPSKAVLVSYGQLQSTAEGAWPPGTLGPSDRYYSVLPLFHVAAKQAVDAVLRSGGQLVVRERFSTGAFWSDVRATGVTATCLMGSMAAFLMNAPEAEDDASHSLDKVLLLPLPPTLDAFRARFGVRVRTLYNQTEVSVPLASDGFDTPDHRSCGRVRAGYECRVVDADDVEVPVGEVGELVVRAERPWSLMLEYLGAPEATAAAWRNLWLHTGDAFTRDAAGRYFFVDRLDDVIRRRGENISSAELEASVCEHPAVAECAAVGVASEWGEEDVKVVVVPAPGASVDPPGLLAFLEQRLPRFMLPRYVDVVAALPKTPTAKVRKRELRDAGVGTLTWDRESAAAGRSARTPTL